MKLMKYRIHDFIDKVKTEPMKWINYCEILLDPIGNVILISVSHQETAIQYMCDKESITRNDIIDIIKVDLCDPLEFIVDKHNLVAVWYECYMHSNRINRLQKRSLEILKENNLIRHTPKVSEVDEYRRYIYRHKMMKKGGAPNGNNVRIQHRGIS